MPPHPTLTFTAQTHVSMPASLHGFAHANLRVQVWDAATPRQRVQPGGLHVDPTTFEVTADFLQPQSGILVVQGALGPVGALAMKQFPFALAAGGTATVTGAQHGFGTDHLLVDVYDAATPRSWLPLVPVAIHPTTFAITVPFLQAQSGLIVVSGASDGVTPNVSVPVQLVTGGSQTIPGASHALGTATLGVQCYDSAGLEILPGQLTIHPSTYAITLGTLQPLTGTLIVNGPVTQAVSGPRMVIASGGTLLLGGASMGQTGTALELTTGYYSFTFVDETQQGVDGAVLDTLTLTYYDTTTGQVLNSRVHQNVLNANQGVLTTVTGPPLVTTFTLELLPADAAILDQNQPTESRTMLLQWTWAGGQRAGARTVNFVVTNLNFVP